MWLNNGGSLGYAQAAVGRAGHAGHRRPRRAVRAARAPVSIEFNRSVPPLVSRRYRVEPKPDLALERARCADRQAARGVDPEETTRRLLVLGVGGTFLPATGATANDETTLTLEQRQLLAKLLALGHGLGHG